MAEVKPNTEKKDKVEGAEGAQAGAAAEGASAAAATPPAAAKPTEVGPNKVDVVLAAAHKTFIGGKWYTFEAGKKQSVSKDVFRVLKDAGLVKITY